MIITRNNNIITIELTTDEQTTWESVEKNQGSSFWVNYISDFLEKRKTQYYVNDLEQLKKLYTHDEIKLLIKGKKSGS